MRPVHGPGRINLNIELTIECAEWGRETYSCCEPDVPEAVRPLIEQLTAMARRKRA